MSDSKPFVSLPVVRRIVVTVIGGSILIIGVALLVLPGPAFIVIPIGLAILATEYAWARRWLRKAQEYARDLTSKKDPGAGQDTRKGSSTGRGTSRD